MESMKSSETGPSRKNVGHMFDRIAERYDFVNHFLSMRRDVAWRKKLVKHIPNLHTISVLDLATGTGDLLLALLKDKPQIHRAIGMDISQGMLDVAKRKVEGKSVEHRVHFELGDAMAIPFDKETFDVVTIGFGIRNVENVQQTLREMYRVLKPGGRALILEFSQPIHPLFRKGYFFYLRHILPRVGAWISGDKVAYSYLNKTVEHFPYGEAFKALMTQSGFVSVSSYPLTYGIATIYQGDK